MLKKYRRIEDVPDPWHDRDDPKLWKAIASNWRLSDALMPRVPPPRGLHRFGSIEAAQKADDEWTRARVAAVGRERLVPPTCQT
jgi:hypothetical protein